MAESTTVSLPDVELFKRNALYWANNFREVCLLDSNNYPHKSYTSIDWLLAIDAMDEVQVSPSQYGGNAFEQLQEFQLQSKSSIFGFLSYDLKNEIEKIDSSNFDGIQFPELYFFQPRYVFEIKGNKVTINRNYPETFELLELIQNLKLPEMADADNRQLRSRTPREKYLQNIEGIRKQIERGDFYELNYCNEFYSDNATINPIETFLKLNGAAKAPFSSFIKLDDKFLLCASPERFLRKEGGKLISQPIKGTIRKGNSKEENESLKKELANNPKERAENVMIVDLVRNDLAHSSQPGTVQVDELFGIYEFNSVNQMISTVTSQIENGTSGIDAIKNAFPMGSMTGAPKVQVMKNIERYEDFKRGLFSGSVGYITANNDFDFNVVIRSILYNATDKYVSVRVGGAITYASVAENEWNEILLKAESMMKVLQAKVI